ncbi:MAG: hypothetical protein ABSE42_19455 [Bryobacteraceae bacterium]|jgi:hypothetical protein
MRPFIVLRVGVPIAAFCLCAQGQVPPSQKPPGKDAPTETKGLPPRAAPADYPDQAQAGAVTIAAEFQGHAVPTSQGNLTTEDYVALETAFFGPPGARIKLSFDDFTLRINGKKTLPSQPYGVVLGNVKDPEWVPPEPAKPKAPANLTLGDEPAAKEKADDKQPAFPVKIPIEIQRAMNQRVQKAALPEGDRALPVAGLVFFWYPGKVEKIHTIELIYSGAAGKAIVTIEP